MIQLSGEAQAWLTKGDPKAVVAGTLDVKNKRFAEC